MNNPASSMSFHRQALNWRASVQRLRASGLVGGALLGLVALAPHARAQDNYTYTGDSTGTAATPTNSATFTSAFTDTTTGTANTTPANPAGTLTFGGGGTTYAATDDIANLNLNGGLTFANTTGSTVTINAANGATVAGTGGAGTALGFAVSTGTVVFNPAINEGPSTLTFSGGGTGSQTTIGGVISGSGGMTDGSAGTLTLNALNTYLGGTTVNGGSTLVLNTSSGSGTVQGAVTVSAGATLNLAANDALGYNAGAQVTTINVNGGTVTSAAGHNEGFLTSYNLTGGTVSAGSLFRFSVGAATPPTIASLASGTTSQFNANIDDFGAATNNLVISVAKGTVTGGADLQIGGAIQGGGGLDKTGGGLLNLTGQNTFSGPVIIDAGTVNVGTPAQNNGSAGALGLSNNGKAITVSAGATLSGTTTNWFGNQGNAGTLPTITVNGGTLSAARYTSIGALVLNGATVTTNDAVDAGNYQTFALRGDVTVGGTSATTITAAAATATTGGIHLGANTTFTVAATGSAAPDLTVSAPLRDQSGDFGNAAGGLTKAGAGTMLLSGANTYTGATTVNAGTLLVNGSTAAASAVAANNSGTVLGGTGTVGGAATVNTGSIVTGAGTGTVGTLTLQSTLTLTGGTFAVDILGATADRLTIAGALALTNANITFSGTPTAPSYVLATFASETGAFTGTAPSGYAFQFNAGGTELDLVAVPEPATWLAGCLAFGLLGATQGRRIGRLVRG